MNSSNTTIARVQERLLDAVDTAGERTPDEQRDLLADLLAEALDTIQQDS